MGSGGIFGHVAELVYAYVSEAYSVRIEGSSPSVPTASLRARARASKLLCSREGLEKNFDILLASKIKILGSRKNFASAKF